LTDNAQFPDKAAQAVALIARSIALQQGGEPGAALDCLNAAVNLVPDFPPALVKRGTLLLSLAQPCAALADFERCLEIAPGMAHVMSLKEAAEQAMLVDLAAHADSASQYCALAELLARRGRHEEALVNFRQATAIDPEYHAAWNGLGNLLLHLNRHAEALVCYETILRFLPNDQIAHFNRGNVLQQQGAYREALASYERALKVPPVLAEVMMEQAHCYFALGDWRRGWPLFESRWKTEQLRHATQQTSAPAWRGEDAPDGTLLLWAEQGLGDTLQFVRYVHIAASRVAHVVLRVPGSLCSLLRCVVNEKVSVVAEEEPVPRHDQHCPLMSLPLVLQAFTQFLPQGVPYLRSPETTWAKWYALLGPKSRPRIGLVWAGGQRRLNNPTRDMPLQSLLPLLEFDAEWFSLQKPLAHDDKALLALYPQMRCMDALLIDFADTAALLNQLDLLISVDTAVAHLAGALGTPTWLILRKSGEWRWQGRPDDTPWYPHHRLYRQNHFGEWQMPVGKVMAELPRYFHQI
jgi:tetratricopeptide (TPR) repeat protein